MANKNEAQSKVAQQESTSNMNLFEKISAIRKMVEALQKNKAGYGYRYVSEDEILAKITAGLQKYKVDVLPRVVSGSTTYEPYTEVTKTVDKNGKVLERSTNSMIVKAEMEFTWVNLDNTNETYIVTWPMIGQQANVSQAFGSGLTYCMRYFYLKFFKVSTLEDDPDNWKSKQEEAAAEQDAGIVAEIIAQVDAEVKAHVNEENKADVSKFIKNIAGTANYNKVKDPMVAAKLLEDLKEYFEGGKK